MPAEQSIPPESTNPQSNKPETTSSDLSHLPETWLIGSGQVVDKYWFRAMKKGLLKITGIISLENEAAFRERHPDFTGQYRQTASLDETIELLAEVIDPAKESVIANVATADIRFPLTERVLEDHRFDKSKLFIEKPYGSSHGEIQKYRFLVQQYPDRLHFSGKYSQGRGDILYPRLPLHKVPNTITASLIEGTDYFRIVEKRVLTTGSHPYLVDGPEWDIGFHLFTVIARAAERFGGFSHFDIRQTADLSAVRKDFIKEYGFGAELFLVTKTGIAIPINIQVGKGRTKNGRYVDFEYDYHDHTFRHEFHVRQYYTVGKAIDPVWLISENQIKELSEHKIDHDYYSVELQPDKFCKQPSDEQDNLLKVADLCFSLKALRIQQDN